MNTAGAVRDNVFNVYPKKTQSTDAVSLVIAPVFRLFHICQILYLPPSLTHSLPHSLISCEFEVI